MQLSLPRSFHSHLPVSRNFTRSWPDDRWHEVALARLILESFLILCVTAFAVYLYSASVAG